MRRLLTLWTAALIIATAFQAPRTILAQTSASITIPELADVKNAIGESPEDLFERYGRPAKVEDAGT